MSEITLRPYQEKFIDDIRKAFGEGSRRVVGVAPCGAGKTIMTGWMIRETMKRGKSALFMVHRKELIDQTSAAFHQLGIPHGIILSGVKPNYDLPVQIASVQTLVNRLDKIIPPDLIVVDECHHILANTYLRITDTFRDAYLLGVTATPERTGGVKLNKEFEAMVLAPSVSELIELGNLTHFNYHAVKMDCLAEELKSVKISKGDYEEKLLEQVVNKPRYVQAVIQNYRAYSLDESAICYCAGIRHSKTVAEMFKSGGITAAHIDGTTDKRERFELIKDFRQGNIKVLCNVGLFGEGFDVPCCQTVILARPTQSTILHIQQSMRSMRPDPLKPNKVATIIDLVGNNLAHGLPDSPRDWNLIPQNEEKYVLKVKGDGEQISDNFKECPNCEEYVPVHCDHCPACGYQFFNDSLELEGSYDSCDNEVKGGKQGVIRGLTFDEYVEIAKQRGHKPSWAFYQRKKLIRDKKELFHIADVLGYKKGWVYHMMEKLKISA